MQVVKLIHITSLLIWLGSLAVLIQLMRNGLRWTSMSGDSVGEVCRKIYLRMDLPFFILTIGTGIFLFLYKDVNAKAGWFHMKMTGMLLLVACDIWVARTIGIYKKKELRCSRLLPLFFAVSLLVALSAIYVVRDIMNEKYAKLLVQK